MMIITWWVDKCFCVSILSGVQHVHQDTLRVQEKRLVNPVSKAFTPKITSSVSHVGLANGVT